MHVLDSSAFIDEYTTDEQIATIPMVRGELEESYELLATERLEPYHDDHLGVVARPRE